FLIFNSYHLLLLLLLLLENKSQLSLPEVSQSVQSPFSRKPFCSISMASSPRITSSFVSLLLLLSSFSFSTSSSDVPRTTDSPSDKVSLALYYESLCPYSANFIVNHLVRVFEDDELLSIVDLYLSPWGNAKIRSNGTFVCQHGQVECLLNTVEACAIDAWPKLEKHFPFIYCVEEKVYERKPMEWESCFGELALDPQTIQDCYGSGYGNKLELKYAAETVALTPPHQYVPWVVVNGQPLYEVCSFKLLP
ncbi:Gamma-interferon-responsive lysosomal thiol protein, partial [Linum grandiflorum]